MFKQNHTILEKNPHQGDLSRTSPPKKPQQLRNMRKHQAVFHQDLLTRLQPPVFDFDALPASASSMAAAPVAGAAMEHLASEMEHLPFDGRRGLKQK